MPRYASDLKQHFTVAKEINSLMCDLLGRVHGLQVLEPSVGHGAFLEGLHGKPSRIVAVDVDPSAIAATRNAFPELPIQLYCTDFIDAFMRDIFSDGYNVATDTFDAVISNPPYGLYIEKSYRTKLKKRFPNFYVRESFGLFFLFAITTLKAGGKYVFLLPDTFLSSKNHRPLRQFMAQEAAPTAIIRFPSKKFESIKFGYGNLCIIAGTRRTLGPNDSVRWFDGCCENPDPLRLESIESAKLVTGSQLLENIETGWSTATMSARKVKQEGWTTLGEISECRTGIYTGNNVEFIGYDPMRVTKKVNGHAIDWHADVCKQPLNEKEKFFGVEGLPRYVPLIRGGHRPPFEGTPFAIDWSEAAVRSYKSGKARFQNAKFYFRAGLSVPMVSTRRISAALMTGAVFDQGVVGVFPLVDESIAALLVYLNSSIASRLMKELVNGSANNSANYLKRLPVPMFSEDHYRQAQAIIKNARRDMNLPRAVCDDFMENMCDITTLDRMLDRDVDFAENDEIRAIGRLANQ